MKRAFPAIFILAMACGGGGGERTADGAPKEAIGAGESGTPAGAATASGGEVTGKVTFTGTAPANPTIDMAEEPTCKEKYGAETPRDPVIMASNGNLANVVVYLKEGAPQGQARPAGETPTLDQEGCVYRPRVLAVMVNQPIKIKNSDAVLHNIKAVPKANRGFNISQPSQGMETERTFARAENAIPMQCNVHGWMKANVFVFDHPYYAVTGEDGSFSIRGLPAGTYTLEAWHEKLGTKTGTVTVDAEGKGTASFTFSS